MSIPCEESIVVNTPLEGVVAPIVVLSIVPALISAVVATNELVVTAAALDPPMIVPSIVPPLMSAVVSTELAIVITPVEFAIVADAVPSAADIDAVSTSVAVATPNLMFAYESIVTLPAVVPSSDAVTANANMLRTPLLAVCRGDAPASKCCEYKKGEDHDLYLKPKGQSSCCNKNIGMWVPSVDKKLDNHSSRRTPNVIV